jgi:lipoprotein-anchoring transpeptidase ErfK/SrfK
VKTSARTIAVGLLVICALLGFATAFAVAASAGAGTGPAQTTDPPTTSEPPATEPPPAEPPAEPPPPTPAPIPFGVTVGGVKVGGYMPEKAAVAVKRVYERPLVLVVDDARRIELQPSALGAQPNFPKAIRRARVARPGAQIPLDVAVSQARVRKYVERIAGKYDRLAVDAHLDLDGLKPRPVRAEDGRRLARLVTGRAIRGALARNARTPIQLPFAVLKPKVESAQFDKAIVIMRSSNRLLYYDHLELARWFGVATGQSAYPTPLGDFEIVTMQRNPWWYPPPSPWAEDEQPVPPGPGNPLGTRWMGLSTPYVGIHGTPDAASIGYSASHGCIRMRIPDAEWLFAHVKVGTPVFIVNR